MLKNVELKILNPDSYPALWPPGDPQGASRTRTRVEAVANFETADLRPAMPKNVELAGYSTPSPIHRSLASPLSAAPRAPQLKSVPPVPSLAPDIESSAAFTFAPGTIHR